MPFTHRDLGQVGGHPGGILDSRHTGTVRRRPVLAGCPPAASRTPMTSTALLIMDVEQGIVDRFAGLTAA
jgi:hypothetical protein